MHRVLGSECSAASFGHCVADGMYQTTSIRRALGSGQRAIRELPNLYELLTTSMTDLPENPNRVLKMISPPSS